MENLIITQSMQSIPFQCRFKNKLAKVPKGGNLQIIEQNAVMKIEIPVSKYHKSSPEPQKLPPLISLSEKKNKLKFNNHHEANIIRYPTLEELSSKSPTKKLKLEPLLIDQEKLMLKSIPNYRNLTHRMSVNILPTVTQLSTSRKSKKILTSPSYCDLFNRTKAIRN